MKILYFLRDISDCGGIQQVTCTLINSLMLDNNYEIETLSLYHKNQVPFFKINSSVINHVLFDHFVDTRKAFSSIKHRFEEVIKDNEYDMIVVQGTEYSNYITDSLWHKNKIIVCEHGYFNMGKLFGLHWMGKHKALNMARGIVTLTALDAQNYREKNKRNIIIRNIYNPCVRNEGQEEKYNTTSKMIVSCGRLDNTKRVDHIIETAKIVLKKYPEWKWYIFGDGSQKESLEQLIRKYNLQNNVFLEGYEKSKNIIYGDKAFFVLTSRFEGFGMVLIEAMQYHLPVISYNVNYGPKEIINDGVNGCLVPDGNIGELALTIEKLIEDNSVRSILSEGAYRSLDEFSLDTITNQWIDLFESV